MRDLWFRPTGLHYSKIPVRGPTAWHVLEIQDGHGGFGIAEIVAKADGRDVLGVAARLANRLRGEPLDSDRAVLDHLRLGEADLTSDPVAASAVSSLRAAVADALARRAQLPLVDYLRMEGGLAGEVPDKVELYANINRSMLPDDRGPVDRSPDAFCNSSRHRYRRRISHCEVRPVRRVPVAIRNNGFAARGRRRAGTRQDGAADHRR